MRASKLKREQYLKKIRPFYDDQEMIKVLEGMRRSGKSEILNQIVKEIKSRGVPEESIIYINLEKKGFRKIRTADQLEALLEERCQGKDNFYLFIDEIQRAEGFEEVLEEYRLEGNCSIFITGSNSYLMSGELATYLTGRYISFEILPFTFQEAYEYGRLTEGNDYAKLEDYLSYGGLPYRFSYGSNEVHTYVSSVISEIIKKDLAKKVKNKELFTAILTYISVNPGIVISYASIQKYLKGEGIKTTRNTIAKYVDLLEKAKLVYLIKPSYLKGKQSMKAHPKSYLTDFGLRKAMAPATPIDYSSQIENIVFLTLLSKNYNVTVGRMNDGEIDFVAERGGKVAYFQVTVSLVDNQVREREFKSLLSVKDNYPKYIISLDPLSYSNKGIIHLKLIDDFLLNDAWEI